MKRAGKIAIGLAACGLALGASARAEPIALADNPYTAIVTRNIFSLNQVQAADAASNEPPVKITLNGLMSVSGRAQVLFKVAGTGKPGQPPKDLFYILSEGQRQDDIEVVHVDEQAELVTFNNHGVIQEIPLSTAPVITSSAGPGSAGQPVPRPAFGRPGHGPGGRGGENGGGNNRYGIGGAGNNANRNSNAGGGSGLPYGSSSPNIYQPPVVQNNLSPEERAAELLLKTEQLQSQGNPAWKVMPPVVPPPPGQ